MKRKLKIPLTVQILVGLGLGLIVGLSLGRDATPLGELGKVVIQLIKMMATPLLFFAIVNSIIAAPVTMKHGLRMILIATFNATLAVVLGLILSNTLQVGETLKGLHPAEGVSVAKVEKIDFLKTFLSYIPSNLVQPFAENTIITVVLLALLLGFSVRALKKSSGDADDLAKLEAVLRSLQKISEVILMWMVYLIPFAVFGVVAKSVGEYGLEPLHGLVYFVGVVILGFLVHVLVVYQLWIRVFARIPLAKFWRAAKAPTVYALGTNSSLATLPLTLRALDDLKVSKSASTMGACVGTNLNNDGIILYEAMALFFVAQAMGVHMSVGDQVLAILACMVAAVGVAGIPEAGFISLSLVLTTVGLPLELLPLLLTVDWILARCRSAVNVLSDMTVSITLDRLDRKRA